MKAENENRKQLNHSMAYDEGIIYRKKLELLET
jgi:hypothetical protein